MRDKNSDSLKIDFKIFCNDVPIFVVMADYLWGGRLDFFSKYVIIEELVKKLRTRKGEIQSLKK